MSWQDDENDEPDDRDAPDDADRDASDEPEFIDCPSCGKSVSEDAERCHHCGNYISAEDAPPRRSWLIIVGVALTAAAVLFWVFF